MTEHQLRLLDFIRERIVETGLAPTYPEMCAHLGVRSRKGVSQMVDGLVRAGLVERAPRQARGLRLPNDVNIALVPTDRLEAELRRRRRAPMWSREFRDSLRDAQPPVHPPLAMARGRR